MSDFPLSESVRYARRENRVSTDNIFGDPSGKSYIMKTLTISIEYFKYMFMESKKGMQIHETGFFYIAIPIELLTYQNRQF